MSNKGKTYVLRGTLHWAKVLGKPRLNEYSGENEWSVDLTPDANSRAALRDIGITDRLKTPKGKDDRKDTFLSFRQRELNKDGDPNRPIRVQDARGNDWPQDKLLGNGTVADVKFIVRDYGKGKPKGVYIQAIRVLEHVPYDSVEFAPLSDDDEYFGTSVTSEDHWDSDDSDETEAPAGFDADLDDDVPF